MATNLTIPEWTGSSLTNGAFLDFATRSLEAYSEQGFDALSLMEIGPKLTEAINAFKAAVNRESSYDETADVASADNDRDACFKALYHAWSYLTALSPKHPFAEHVKTLKSEMDAYKGVWRHEMRKETSELRGLQTALFKDMNRTALAELGLDKIAAALWAANEAVHDAMEARSDEQRGREEEKATGATAELRKAVATQLIRAAKRVNAVNEINPEDEASSIAVSKVATLVKEYKNVASEAKHRKGDDPEPEPEAAAS